MQKQHAIFFIYLTHTQKQQMLKQDMPATQYPAPAMERNSHSFIGN